MTGTYLDFEELHNLFHPTTPEADEIEPDPDHAVKSAKEDAMIDFEDEQAARVEDFYCGSDYPGRTGP
jgi:hypothetical protein